MPDEIDRSILERQAQVFTNMRIIHAKENKKVDIPGHPNVQAYWNWKPGGKKRAWFLCGLKKDVDKVVPARTYAKEHGHKLS